MNEYEKRIREVTRCSDIVYAAQRSEGYEMSRFGSYLSALSEHEKKDRDMAQLTEVCSLLSLNNQKLIEACFW